MTHTSSATEIAIPHKHFDDTRLEQDSPTKLVFPKIQFPLIEPRDTHDPTAEELLHFTAKRFRFIGNTVFSDAKLASLVKQFQDTPINTFDLEELRLVITKHYFNHGYINSGALFPDHIFDQGELIINITEGRLTRYNVTNEGRLGPEYIEKRLSFDNETLLQLGTLQNKLFILLKDPHIEKIDASLRPTILRGQSILDLKITEKKPYSLAIELNNHSDANTGEELFIMTASHNNIDGKGDTINAELSKSEGSNEVNIQYYRPLNSKDDFIKFEYGNFNTDLTESATNAGSSGYDTTISYIHPLHKSIYEEYWLEYKLNRYETSTFNNSTTPLNGECTQGKCNVTALRLTQSWKKRTHIEKYQFTHTVSHGNDIFGGGERFTTLQLDFQRSRRHPGRNNISIIRTSVQMSRDKLPASEKFAVSGFNHVRGYNQSHLTTDKAITINIESQLPFWQNRWKHNKFTLIAFYDTGRGWDNDSSVKARTIKSIGLGLHWIHKKHYTTKIYWADTRDNNTGASNSLQSDGIYISVKADIF